MFCISCKVQKIHEVDLMWRKLQLKHLPEWADWGRGIEKWTFGSIYNETSERAASDHDCNSQTSTSVQRMTRESDIFIIWLWHHWQHDTDPKDKRSPLYNFFLLFICKAVCLCQSVGGVDLLSADSAIWSKCMLQSVLLPGESTD